MKQGQFPAILPLASLNGQNGFKLDGENIKDQSGYFVNWAGDFNGDGYDDLIIGSYGYPGGINRGRSYVVFGGLGVGSGGLFNLSSLTGSNGFKLDGENNGDWSGVSVSAAGDFNVDGYDDLIIGAHNYPGGVGKGRSYVVFGGAGVGSSGIFSLSSLNGTNGFKLDGEDNNDQSGAFINADGDISGDGYNDLIIGAWGYLGGGGKGRSYVVFGGSGIGSGGLASLSSLNGITGFKLDGENNGDYSAVSPSIVGDISGDGYDDLLIGADRYLAGSLKGRSYLVFGGPGVGNSSLFNLSSLNGANGFKLDGENNNDWSGHSISKAGDINGDGHADIIIDAYGYPKGNYTGRSYVVFGGQEVGSKGVFNLSSLNGANGFKLDGENNNDYNGNLGNKFISAAGDINGDGYGDVVIGVYGYPGGNSKGRSYILFGGYQVGSRGTIALSSFDGISGFIIDGENNNDYSGISVSAAGDINGDGVADLIIGAYGYPGGSNRGRSYVIFGDIPPVLVNNSLSLSVGAAIQLNSTYLSAYDRNHNNNTLVFVPSGVTHGQFESVSAPGVALVNFTQQQIISGVVQFVHDGTLVAPTYNITVRSPGIAWTGPASAKVTFLGTPLSYFPAVIPVASLNGQNGFRLEGETAADTSGYSMSTASDVNGDGYADMVIGAPSHNNEDGRTYVVFGGPNVGQKGLITLSSLNGTQGFKINGRTGSKEQNGFSVSGCNVNGDLYGDLLIGAYLGGQSDAGRSYVVLGSPGIGSQGWLNVTALNGANGFRIEGGAAYDFSGSWVSPAGDINQDGYDDLVIGAPHGGVPYAAFSGALQVGHSDVVFGSPALGNSGVFNLSSLNGLNGFRVNGQLPGDQNGYTVSAGDINGDGVDDLLTGVLLQHGGSRTLPARSYVIFGGVGVGKGGSVNLTALTGQNGFQIDGELTTDYGNGWVSGWLNVAGDINGDGYAEVIVGAFEASPGGIKQAGRSYVIFGGTKIHGNGSLSLTGLNGANGFKLDGSIAYEGSGSSVNTAGDVNGDGYADLVIGANGLGSVGGGYVIFGGRNIGKNGSLPLSTVDGTNGFQIENNASYNINLGWAAGFAGDVNGDGIDDFFITDEEASPGGRTNAGCSYVIFGDAPPTLVQNRLSLYPGLTVSLNSSFLSAYDRNHNNNTLVFVPTAVSHGQFELITQPGVFLMNFTQPQLIGGSVRFIHDGSSFTPSYDMTVYSAGIAWTGPSSANITFIPAAAATVVSTPVTTSQTLTPVQTPTPSVTGTVTPSPSPSSTPIPSTPTPTATSTLTPSPAGPVLLTNQLTLSDGQTVILSSNNLQASEAGFNDSQLVFSVGNVRNGYFSTVLMSNGVTKNLTSFTQAQIQSGAVEFIHADNGQAPAYAVLVSDGVQSTLPSAAMIHFKGAPIITQNTLNITVGGTITLTPALLNVTATDGSAPSQVIITVSNLQHATLTSTVTGMPVNNFTLADVQAGDIQLTDDGSSITPSYTITVEGVKSLSSAPNQSQVYLSNQGVYAPQLGNNYLAVTQGAATQLSNRYLSAMQPNGQALDNDNATQFYISDINHGHFSLTIQPQTWISFFNQEQLSNGQVQFIQDGSLSIPGYSVSAKAFGLQSASQPAGIFFTPVNEAPPLTSSTGGSDYSTVQKAIIGAVVSGTIGIFFAVFQVCLKRAANKKLLQALGEGTDEYDLTVVRPVAKEIAQRIKITGFLNATTNREMMSFKGAVRSLLTALDERGVDLNLADMKPAKKDALVNEIGNQVERWVKVNRRRCTACCPNLTAFFKPQLNPDSLRAAAGEIADNIVQARKSQLSLSVNLSVSGSPVYQEPQKKPSVELGLVDSSRQSNPPEEVRSDLSSS